MLFLALPPLLFCWQCIPRQQQTPPLQGPAPQPPGRLPQQKAPALNSGTIRVSPAAANRIGQKIWNNEAGGSVAGLTSWNEGEYFASMGIGHFIWYPAKPRKTYEESFPRLLRYLQSKGVQLPNGLTPSTACPWPNSQAFMGQFQSKQLRELRAFLQKTVAHQTQFIIQRMQAALPKMQYVAPRQDRNRIAQQFYAVSEVPNGVYALIDYVNFKGEGTSPTEHYRNQGWGLMQVLQGMQGNPRSQAAAREFSASAKRVLERRITNAPKDESRWRTGWFRRCDTYAQPF